MHAVTESARESKKEREREKRVESASVPETWSFMSRAVACCVREYRNAGI